MVEGILLVTFRCTAVADTLVLLPIADNTDEFSEANNHWLIHDVMVDVIQKRRSRCVWLDWMLELTGAP